MEKYHEEKHDYIARRGRFLLNWLSRALAKGSQGLRYKGWGNGT